MATSSLRAPMHPSDDPVPEGALTAPERVSASAALSALSRVVVGDHVLGNLAHRVAELAVATVPGVTGASVALMRGGTFRTVAFAGAGIAALDERQVDLGDGPGRHAARTGTLVAVRKTTNCPIYPRYAVVAAQAGITSVLCIGLPVAGRAVGALTVSCTGQPHELAPGSIALAAALARYAAVALANAERHDDARAEPDRRHTAPAALTGVSLAAGVDVTHERVGPQDAVMQSPDVSQNAERTLREVIFPPRRRWPSARMDHQQRSDR